MNKTITRGDNQSLQLERLEERQLLAGLTLAGVLPTDGVLLLDGEIRNVAPQDLTLRFDQDVDPATLSAIQLIRSGNDDAFSSATVSTDFSTNGAVRMRFNAAIAGDAGNGVTLIVSTANLGSGSATPRLSVNNNTVLINLNSNPLALTTAFDLRDSLNADPVVSALVTAEITGGNAFTTIGDRPTTYSPLTLSGANTARGTVTFNKPGLEIGIRSVQPGVQGNGIAVNFSLNNLGGVAPPQITVSDRVVNIVLNSNPGNETRALALVTAINNDLAVNQLIRASINSGDPLTVIGNVAPPAPLLLTGANDEVITPGFIGLGPNPGEVIMRFAESLPDDSYLLSISGTGANPLRTPDGMILNEGARDEIIQFELDLGTQIISVVPQPIMRGTDNRLTQQRNKIQVFFNNDDLDRDSAETPSFYQLKFTGDTVTTNDDVVFLPTDVAYSAAADMAELTFAGPIDELTPGGAGGAWRLRIGTDEGAPLAPNRLTPGADPGSTFANAFDLTTAYDTGSVLVVQGGGDLFADGQTMTVVDEDGTMTTFEFEDTDAGPAGVSNGNTAISFTDAFSQLAMRDQIALTIGGVPGLDVIVTVNNSEIFVDGDRSLSVSPGLIGVSLAKQGIIVSGSIDNSGQPYELTLPGGNNDIGHREIANETHLNQGADGISGISTAFYNFQEFYGFDPLGNVLRNEITEIQKDRAREIFQIYDDLLGIQFIESPTSGYTIVTGDMRAIDPELPIGVGGVLGVAQNDPFDRFAGRAIMDLQDFDETGDDLFGDAWFNTAMHEIGHLLGLGHTYDLPDPTLMGSDPSQNPVPAEPIFPADGDIIHGQHLYRPESKDIDLYRFKITESGILTTETIAERLASPSLLDTMLTLYRENDDGTFQLVARNDDYNSEDSLIEVEVTPGTYFIGVTASGNDAYDPTVEDSGFGGVTQGAYELRIDFRAVGEANSMFDVDNAPTPIDGDGDGVAGGIYNYWFRTQSPANTLIVDKAATSDAIAADPNLFNNIDDAIARSRSIPGSIVRIVGNGGADGDVATLEDNLAYEIGFSEFNGTPLADGTLLEVPKGVTVMIDSSAIVKLRRGRIGVGSSDLFVDRSGSSLQVLGVPRLIDSNGNVRRDELGRAIPGSVYFTSIHDDALGVDTDPNINPPAPAPRDWGGIIFRRAIDKDDAARFDYEDQGIFLNYVNHADIQYGGGEVVIDANGRFVAPIEMDEARATISYNTIHNNASSAIVATPDTFEEHNFHEAQFQLADEFTSDYSRIGPEILNNHVFDNSVNGLEIRIDTPPGRASMPLTVKARFDDASITHILRENLRIEGAPGGPISEDVAPPVRLVTLTDIPLTTGTVLPAGEYTYVLVNVDANGNEGPPSSSTTSITLAANSTEAIRLANLPPAAGFAARRLYRSVDGSPFVLAAELNSFSTSFVDDGSTIGGALAAFAGTLRARPDATLIVDPRVVVKISDSVIDVGVGAQLIAEGRDGEEVVFTSIHDQRYGAGGTFNTNTDLSDVAQPGNWSGLFGWHQSTVSLEHAVIAYGGGTTRQVGGFRGFSAIEAHQSNFRIANSVVELNADGTAAIQDSRFGRGSNGPAAVFVRGNEPIIVANIFRNNEAQAISLDVNSLSGELVEDFGGSRGPVEQYTEALGNQGALIRDNMLTNNTINGLVVRGGTLTRDSVWDDTDIVHVVFDQITVPNLHTYGGLRLESSSTESLVVKLDGATAGFVAAGQQLDINDRVGGAIHIIGQATKPVILTSLTDFSVGAGFTPDGQPQVNTDNADLSIYDTVPTTGLPTIGEVDRGTIIDNDVINSLPGSFSVVPGAGGSLQSFSTDEVVDENGFPLSFQNNRATMSGALSGVIVDQDFIFEYLNYLDVGADGLAVDLATTTITQPPTLIADDVVASEGTIAGNGGNIINWRVETSIRDGDTRLTNTLTLTSEQPLGDVRFINYLDEDLGGISDDFLNPRGTPGAADFRAYTLDGPERVGFSQGGFYSAGPELVNATYDGWAADQFADLRTAITGPGTTYTVAGNIDTVDLPQFQDPTLGTSYGAADITTAFAWSVDPLATTATITSFLELLPQDPGGVDPDFGSPGDWQGIVLESFSHDRNVDIRTELEAQDAITGSNGELERAEFLGTLAPNEKTSDENLRLGIQVNGVLSSVNDVDYYRFDASGGTDIVIDIDRTTHALDTMVELLGADGTVLAASSNSTAEIADPSLIQRASFLDPSTINPLRISNFSEPDRFTTNPRDAGFKIRLNGSPTNTGPFFLRVSSRGSKGAYQLQVRINEVDEFAGSTIRNADIRFADTGIAIVGQPIHSPLTGENAEDLSNNNDTIAGAQNIGNLLETDRAALSVAGRLSRFDDVDLYQFEVSYEDVQPGANVGLVPIVIDLDYADGIARPNTIISVFDANGELVASTRDANVAGDLPRAGFGNDMKDLSRGSAGGLDPFLGPISLEIGTYFVGITSDAILPRDFEQTVSATPVNPLARLEPNFAITRIVDEHIDDTLGTPNLPVVPDFLGQDSVVPYFLNDVVLYISHNAGGDNTVLSAVNPFTGAIFTNLGNIGREIADIDFRNDNTLVALTKDLKDGVFDDAESGNYLSIDVTGASGTLGTRIGDDGIETYELNVANPPNSIRSHLFQGNRVGDGIHYEAITVGTYRSEGQVGYAVGNRPCIDIDPSTLQCRSTDDYIDPPGVSRNHNILYEFNPNTGAAFSSATDRSGAGLVNGAGTNIIERGFLNTGAAIGAANNNKLVVTAEPTDITPAIVSNIIDEQVTFVIDNTPAPNDTFQLVSGPELQLVLQPATATATDVPSIFQDGWTFEVNGTTFEIETGEVIVVQRDGRFFNDGDTFELTDLDGATKTFEFDLDGNVSVAGAQAIPFNSALNEQAMTARIVTAINDPSLSGFTFSAELLPTTNPNFNTRITLLDVLAVTEDVDDPNALVLQGQAGSPGGNLTIDIEETFTNQEFIVALLQTFAGTGIEASAEGDRANFPGATSADFSNIFTSAAAAGVGDPIIDLGHDHLVSIPGAIAVPFGVADSQVELAVRIADVLNTTYGPGFAIVDGSGNVELLGTQTFASADAPLVPAGAAPGGTITGITIAQVGGTQVVFAVSNRGGLYRISNPQGFNAQANYISTSTQLSGIEFSGLTTGPTSVEGGRYANMLFATDTSGRIHAFDYAGVPQPIFLDSATSIATGLTGGNGSANGLAFSNLERNMWGVTGNRRLDPGVGIAPYYGRPFSGDPWPAELENQSMLRFGGYNFNGGAFGAVESARFSLEGYSSDDQPVLYFNYFLDTDNGNSFGPRTMTDSFNVYINDGTDNWDLLADNDNALPGPQQLFDIGDNGAPNSWRQARVNLENYAGLDNLQLRFEFHTGGNFEFGTPEIGGFDIRALPGEELRDEDIFTIDGIDFELEFGPTLVAPTGTSVVDGDLFEVDGIVFEFDKSNDGIVNGSVEIDVSDDLSAASVALRIRTAVANAGLGGVTTYLVENRVQLEGATTFDPLTSTVEVDGADGVGFGNVTVALNSDMSDVEVAEVIQQAVADTFANGLTDNIYRYDNVVKIIGHTLQTTGPMPGITASLPGHSRGASSTVNPVNPNGSPATERRFQDNAHEGAYIDDIIIGFAERGEIVTGGSTNGFFNNPFAAPDQVLEGEYQVEIRFGADTNLLTFDTNYRFEGQQASLVAPSSIDILDGQTFVITDGVGTVIFEYEDVNIGDGVADGNLPIPFNPSAGGFFGAGVDNEPSYVIAQRILTAINSDDAQKKINIQASLSDGTTVIPPFFPPELISTDSVINLYGDFVDVGAGVPAPIVVDLSNAAEIAATDGNETIFTATDSGNSSGISATIVGSGEIGDNPAKVGNNAPLDVDMLELRLAVGDVVSIDIDAAELGSTLDSYLRVFDINGNELFTNYQGFAPDDEFFSSDSYLQFIAPSSGTYFIGVSGVTNFLGIGGNTDYDPLATPTGTADFATTGFYDITVDIVSAGIEVIRFDETEVGDRNNFRDQGQLIIQNTTVRESNTFGIDVGAGPRTGPDGDIPHQGSVRNLRELNTQRLVPGATLMNNVLVGNLQGGIRFAGDNQAGALGAVPMGRIVNNTLVGEGQATGILVEDNASPTLLNNIITDFQVGISVAADSSTTVLGGNLLAGNATPLMGASPGQDDIVLASSSSVFLDPSTGVYYLADGSLAVDSSISRLDERSALTTVKMPLGIADSPILAPIRDALGQLRIDEKNDGATGTGPNPFIDRGAIERADNGGPTAVLIDPRDNDAGGVDRDSTVSIVELSLDSVLTHFTIQLLDGVEPANPSGGVGVNDDAISAEQVAVLKDDVVLTEGVDYRFGYDPVNDVIRLTPVAGLWEPNHVYKILLANGDQFVLTAPDGISTNDGDTFAITDQDGTTVTFEYDSGYLLSISPTLTMQVPPEGGQLGGVTDREQFVVSNNATGQSVLFEFDNNDTTSGGTTPVVFTPVMNDNEVAQQIVDALAASGLGLLPKLIGDGQVHVGATPDHTIDLSLAPSLASFGSPTAGGVIDGDVLVVDDGATRINYEFDANSALVDATATQFAFSYGQTYLELAQQIANRLTSDTSLAPDNLDGGRLHVAGDRLTFIDPSGSVLMVAGTPGVFSEFGIQIPSQQGAPFGITDGMTFQVGDGIALPVTFEFDDDGQFVLGNTLIDFDANTTLNELANTIASQVSAVGIGLSPTNVGDGFIELGNDTVNNVFNPLTSVLIQTGAPGVDGNQAISFVPDVSFTSVDMATTITDAVNNSQLNTIATQRGENVLMTNIATVTGGVETFSEVIQDYAGNVLRANQMDGSTQFTILFGEGFDYGDALQLPTLKAFDGARHMVISGYSLGLDVDVDPDGQPTENADGDDNSGRDDEDGVTHDGIVAGFNTAFTVTAQGITASRPGFLDAWVDFDGDGQLVDAERIATSLPLVNGINTINVAIPTTVTAGSAVARFRLSSTGGLGVAGAAPDGEVEDYMFTVAASTWTNPANNYDVVPDSVITPFDLLKVLEFVQVVGASPVPKSGPLDVPAPNGGNFHFEAPPASPYYDVNQDRMINISDLRVLFSYITSEDANGEPGSERPEGEAGSFQATAAPLGQTRVTREVQFQLTPPPEAVDGEQATSALDDTLPLDDAIREVAEEVSSSFVRDDREVDDFFARLGE